MRLCFFFIFASYKVTQLVLRCTLVFSISVNEVKNWPANMLLCLGH